MKSELAYERYAHGEPPDSPSEEDGRRIAELRHADEDFLARHPREPFLRDLARRRRRRSAGRIWTASLAAAACLAFVMLLPRDSEGIRMKGGAPNLVLYHKTEGGTELLGEAPALRTGEEIQLSYFARGRSFAAILSIDGRGSITRHLPLHGPDALAIDLRDYALLPYSFRLDDAPAFEDFYLVVSPRPFRMDEIEPFLRAGFDNGTPFILLPAPFEYDTLRIRKEEAKK